MNEKERRIWSIIGYIEASNPRKKTIKCLGNEEYKKPSNICRETKLSTSQVSNALNDLKSKKLVICLNENAVKGRLYKTTSLGDEILEKLK